jgi:branched-chain amino acid transport system substrate-binding protein
VKLGVGVPLNSSAALTGGGDGDADAAAADADGDGAGEAGFGAAASADGLVGAAVGGTVVGAAAGAAELHPVRHTTARIITKRIADDCARFETIRAMNPRPLPVRLVPRVVAVLVLAACTAPTSAPTPAPTSAAPAAKPTTAPTSSAGFSGSFDGTLLFGAPISLTGSTAKEGGLTRDGYDIWRDTYNAAGGINVGGKHYKIETKYYDDASDAQKSATLADKLINEDKVNFLLGPYGTAPTLQDSTVAEKNKVPMIEGNGAAESIFSQGYKYTFGVLSPAQNYLRGIIDLVLTLDPKPTTVAVLSADDPFSVEVADAVRTYAEQKGLQVVYYQKYPNASTDLRAPLTEAKAKSPDLLLNSGHLQESLAIIQQAKELGFSPKGYGFSVGPGTPDFQTTLQNDANFVLGGTQWTPALKFNGDDLFKTPAKYNDMYKQTFGYEPAYQSADATAVGVSFAKAIEAAGSTDPAKVRDAIAALNFTSFYGVIKFDQRGINVDKPMAVEQWQSGRRVTVWPADVAETKTLWPTPAWSTR